MLRLDARKMSCAMETVGGVSHIVLVIDLNSEKIEIMALFCRKLRGGYAVKSRRLRFGVFFRKSVYAVKCCDVRVDTACNHAYADGR